MYAVVQNNISKYLLITHYITVLMMVSGAKQWLALDQKMITLLLN